MKRQERLYYLLGLFAGDGWFQSRGISIGTKDEERASDIARLLEGVFSKKPIIKRRAYPDGHVMYLVSIYSVAIENRFRQLLGNVKKNKSKTFVPPKTKNRRALRAFVSGLFDAEGYRYLWKNKPRIGFGIYNKRAAIFVLENLKEEGVKASLSKCACGCYRIDITGKKHVDRFCGFYDWPWRKVLAVNDADQGVAATSSCRSAVA